MGSTAEGLYSVQIKKVNELLRKGKNNKKMEKKGMYDKIESVKYGPFTTDVIEWQIYAYPLGKDLKLFLHLPYDDDNKAIKKYGYVNLLDNPETRTLFGVKDHRWSMRHNTLLGHEDELKPDTFADNLRRKIFPLGCLKLNEGCKGDTINTKLAVWFILDPNWRLRRNVCPPDLVANLNRRKFPDISFVVDREIFHAHRAVLAARSDVFSSRLDDLERNSIVLQKYHITIKEMNKLTLQCLLHFIYTNSLPSDFRMDNTGNRMEELFKAAARFKLERLKKICEKYLPRDVISTLQRNLDNGTWKYEFKTVRI